jgi:hypothetical protein
VEPAADAPAPLFFGENSIRADFLDHGKLIEVEYDYFAVVLSQFEAVEPQLVILGVGEP